MSTAPKISFVIPAYNEEGYIGPCLDSILKEISRENYPAEIIVVNNNSTDQTKNMVLKYPGVKLANEPIRGLPRARQRGFLEAQGILVANIDADAQLPAGWLKKVIKAFEKNRKLVCLSGPQVFYDTPKVFYLATVPYYLLMYFTYISNRYLIRRASVVQGGNFVLRRSALLKIGGFNHHLVFYGEDADVAKRLHKIGSIRFTFGLPIYSSARRLEKEGILNLAWNYSAAYVWTILFKKPYSKHNPIFDFARNEKIKFKLMRSKKMNLQNLKKFAKLFE